MGKFWARRRFNEKADVIYKNSLRKRQVIFYYFHWIVVMLTLYYCHPKQQCVITRNNPSCIYLSNLELRIEKNGELKRLKLIIELIDKKKLKKKQTKTKIKIIAKLKFNIYDTIFN